MWPVGSSCGTNPSLSLAAPLSWRPKAEPSTQPGRQRRERDGQGVFIQPILCSCHLWAAQWPILWAGPRGHIWDPYGTESPGRPPNTALGLLSPL